MNKIMTLCASFVLSCIMGVSVFAQGGYEVKGVVVDAIGPVIGATIIEQGTTNGTSTGLDGDYVLTVSSADAVVEISCIGYASQTFVASQVPATVTLSEDTTFLDEVVVIGYGTVKKEDMTGSVTAIKNEELNRGAVVTTQDMLKGKVAGLNIIPGDGGPGSSSTIRIRGAASLHVSNDPLIIIDGVPIANGAGAGMSNPLDMINPNDIESFTVLKDASSAAIYGSRASNGVIMITTKKGKGNKPQVSYSGSASIQVNSSQLPVMSASQYRSFIKDNYGMWWGKEDVDGVMTDVLYKGVDAAGNYIKWDTEVDPKSKDIPQAMKTIANRLSKDVNMNYQDVVFQTAFTHDHNVSMSGNINNRAPYRVSLGIQDQEGTLVGSTYEKATLDLSMNPTYLDGRLSLNLNAKGVYTHSNYGDSGVVGNAAFFNPTQDPYFRAQLVDAAGNPVVDAAGNPVYGGYGDPIDYTTTNGYFNYGTGRGDKFAPNTLLGVSPMSQLNERISYGTSRRFIGSAGVDYKFKNLEALKFVANASLDWSDYNNRNGVKVGSYQAWSDTENRGIGQYSEEWLLRKTTTFESYFNFNETWGKHNLDLMAGYSWQHYYGSSRNISYFNVTDEVKFDYKECDDCGNKFTEETLDGRYPKWAWESYMVSFYARANYSLASKYLFTASIRTDGSSKFAPASRWGVFPSAAFAWNAKSEDYFNSMADLSQLKVRLSAGVTGQQDGLGEYAHLARYGLSTDTYQQYYMGSNGFQFMWTPASYDPNITWETTTTYNAGVDFGFYGDRITGAVDAYLRNTEDLLNNVQTPMGSNFGNTVYTNIGSMQNKGLEFSLNVIPVQTKDWHLSIGVNGTFQDTKITKLNATDDPNYYENASGISHGTGSYIGRHQVGYAPYSYWVMQQLYDETGKPIQNAFVDRNGDGKISNDDRYCAGDPNADFYYGLNMKLQYKNWDFGFNAHGSLGYKVFNDFASNNSSAYFDVNAGNLPNFSTHVLRTGFTEISDDYQYYSDFYLEDASFLRIDDINFGYTFKEVGNWGGTVRVAASCQNVFVFTKYSGIDPEITNANGVDGSFWPRPRTFSVRLNVNF